MPYIETVQRLEHELNQTFGQLDRCFDLPLETRQIHPAKDEWSIDEILEHITLTNHFLMLTLRASLEIVSRRAKTSEIVGDESDLDMILKLADPDAFAWIRPEHMEPTRSIEMSQVRTVMRDQQNECLDILGQIQNGEGSLRKVRMSVQNLGKLDMYQWLYFLIQHAKRHTVEIQRILIGVTK